MTDTAKNPTSAGGGRYRPVLCEPGYSKGRHTWNVKANSAGRLEVGVSSSGFNVKGREGSALNNQSCGWCICVYEPGRNMTLWHAGRRVCYPSFKWQVGSILNVILDCDAHTLEFRLNGKAGSNTKFYNLPRNETFKLTAAFGGDNIRGASLSLVTGKPGKAVDDNIITPVVMTNSLKDIGSNNSILKLGEYSRDPSTVVVPGPLFGSVTELSNAMRNAKEWKARKISRVIIASGTHYVPDGGLRLIGHEFAGLEIRGEGIGKTVLKGGGGGNGKGTIYIENTSGIVHLVNLTLANCR